MEGLHQILVEMCLDKVQIVIRQLAIPSGVRPVFDHGGHQIVLIVLVLELGLVHDGAAIGSWSGAGGQAVAYVCFVFVVREDAAPASANRLHDGLGMRQGIFESNQQPRKFLGRSLTTPIRR